LDDWIYWHLFTQFRTRGNYNAIANLHSLQFTVTHALRFSVFTILILATQYVYQCYCNCSIHEVFVQSNCFLAIRLQQPVPKTRLNSIPLLRSSYPSWLASRNSTLFCATTASFGTLLYNHFGRTTQKTASLLLGRRVCIAVATEVTQLFLAYSLPRECVYRVVA
jgi:hypothetical protein